VTYVVQRPDTGSNHSDKYRVCDVDDWMSYVDEKIESYEFTEWNSYEDAAKYRDSLNYANWQRHNSYGPDERDWDNEDFENIFGM